MGENEYNITPKKRKRYWMACLVLLLLIVLGSVISLTLLNEDWLKSKIEKYVRDTYQTDIEIDSLEFNPWKRHALLSNIVIHRLEPNRDVTSSINFIELDFKLIPLIFRNVIINRLVISQPVLKIEVQRKPETPTMNTLDRLKKVVTMTTTSELLIDPFVEAINQVLEIFVGHIDSTIVINELFIHEGNVDYTAKRVGTEPFDLKFEEVEYSAKNINARMPLDFAIKANITSKIILGETQADFLHHFLDKPLRTSITDIDMAYLDRYLKQKDILQVNSGKANINFLVNDKMISAKIEMDELELKQNKDVPLKDFAFIPAAQLIDYVNQADGYLNLEFEIEKSEIRTSEDMKYFVIEIWEGMWKQIFKKISSEKLENLKEKGTQKILDFLNNTKPIPNDPE